MTTGTALTDTRVMVTRCMRRSLRDPEAFFTALMLPVVLMLLFVYIFGGALNTGGGYADYVVPGLIVLCAGFGAGTTAVAVATDMSSGIVDRFRSMPISGSSILAGHIVASLARNLLATALVIGVGVGVGWRPSASPAAWAAAVAMIVAFILAMSCSCGARKRRTPSRSYSCSSPTCPPRSSPRARCPPSYGRSPRTSRSRR
jgi:ABC-2 type transport system permease protein